jgi:hypothetical protein
MADNAQGSAKAFKQFEIFFSGFRQRNTSVKKLIKNLLEPNGGVGNHDVN